MENEEIEAPALESTQVIVEHKGVPTYFAGIFAGLFVAAVLAAAYFSQHPQETQQCVANNVTLKAQAESMTTQAKLNTETQKRIVDIQMAVAKACVDHGNIPILMGGNVDCKSAK